VYPTAWDSQYTVESLAAVSSQDTLHTSLTAWGMARSVKDLQTASGQVEQQPQVGCLRGEKTVLQHQKLATAYFSFCVLVLLCSASFFTSFRTSCKGVENRTRPVIERLNNLKKMKEFVFVSGLLD
jgi:hypothetical protein